ncbi:Transforming growth factor beta regulator 1 [Choanephora cucurbitarum]|uniref:Transforming growth factor beta regulator 1 n=1 Tax=Choanephora cucurbitarum TaxID=101091 RepID=A0A1C7NKD4_9FUNG|nr:Transforming growth factor beta regulator 1 [Choanephora cucurbitarum]
MLDFLKKPSFLFGAKGSKLQEIKQKQRQIQYDIIDRSPLLIQPVEREGTELVLPQQIGPFKLIDTGTVVFDEPGFHTRNFIFPVGYTVQTLYPSAINPKTYTLMTARIIHGGSRPHFLVQAADQPRHPVTRPTAIGAWAPFIKNACFIRRGYTPDCLPYKEGLRLYGFENDTIKSALQDLPNVSRLDRYVRKKTQLMNSKQTSDALE